MTGADHEDHSEAEASIEGPTALAQTDNRPRDDDPVWADELPQDPDWRPELEGEEE